MSSSAELSDGEGEGEETRSIRGIPRVCCFCKLGRLLFVADGENHDGLLNEEVLNGSSGIVSLVRNLIRKK